MMSLGDWKLTWCDRRKLMRTNCGRENLGFHGSLHRVSSSEALGSTGKDRALRHMGVAVAWSCYGNQASRERERERGIIIYKHFFLLSNFGPHPNPDNVVRSLHPFVTKTFCQSRCGTGLHICIGLRQLFFFIYCTK